MQCAVRYIAGGIQNKMVVTWGALVSLSIHSSTGCHATQSPTQGASHYRNGITGERGIGLQPCSFPVHICRTLGKDCDGCIVLWLLYRPSLPIFPRYLSIVNTVAPGWLQIISGWTRNIEPPENQSIRIFVFADSDMMWYCLLNDRQSPNDKDPLLTKSSITCDEKWTPVLVSSRHSKHPSD